MGGSVAPRKTLFDAIFVRRMNERRAPQGSPALGTLVLAEVAAARAGAQDLAPRGDFEALGDRFFGFDTFRTTHKFLSG